MDGENGKKDFGFEEMRIFHGDSVLYISGNLSIAISSLCSP